MASVVNLNTPRLDDGAPLTAADLADYNRQHKAARCCEANGVRSCDQGRQCPMRQPAEAATHFGADMHRPGGPLGCRAGDRLGSAGGHRRGPGDPLGAGLVVIQRFNLYRFMRWLGLGPAAAWATSGALVRSFNLGKS